MAPRLVPAVNYMVTVQTPHGFRMALDLREHIQQRAFYFGYHEHIITAICARYIQPATTVFDLGANFGQFTLLAAHLAGPAGHVLAFEPNPVVFQRLQENVALNGFNNQVACYQTAVSDSQGTTTFYTSPDSNTGTSSLVESAVTQFHQASELRPIEVELVQLDSYANHITSPVSLIKMDIQGAELPALHGAREILTHYKPTLVLEVDPVTSQEFGYHPRDVGAFLNELGYKIFAVPVRPWHKLELLDWSTLSSHDILCVSHTTQSEPHL